MLKKILIANRGEIAVRVIRACRELDIPSVAVFSDVDREALHVRFADEAYHIGAAPASESYLLMDRIIETAEKSGADAIHPGYGFLAENPVFAEKCRESNIVFIGPSPEAISSMGDKLTAREMMGKAGIPVVPGTERAINDENELFRTAGEIGYPVMLKASAGGGGKGMRMVNSESELSSAFRGATSEAVSSFGNNAVYIEKFISNPRHIEIQILADNHGNTVHLGERECSIQRRHQKVIEECPSPVITPEIRERMGAIAVKAAEAVNYLGAGTVEFLLDGNMKFYFLEMNTRIQVEHAVTEMVCGIDLVKYQLLIASGKKLGFTQSDLAMNGAAIECRIYAEDPDNSFMPSPGTIKGLRFPEGPGIRNDNGVHDGFTVPSFYDPMISKLIVWGNNRREAILRMKRALEEYKIRGIKTTISFHEQVMHNPDFIAGNFNTDFIDRTFLKKKKEVDPSSENIAMIAAAIRAYKDKTAGAYLNFQDTRRENRWKCVARTEGIRDR